MTTLAIVASSSSNLSEEIQAVLRAAERQYDAVRIVNPRNVSYTFLRGGELKIFSGESDLADVRTVLIRGTKGRETSTNFFAHAMASKGCDMLDPLERFPVVGSSKLTSTIRRYWRGLGTTTYIAFTLRQARRLLQSITTYPLLVKPIDGNHSEGLALLPDLDTTDTYTHTFFEQNESGEQPIYLQEYVPFRDEYRILVLDHQSLGIVRKIRRRQQFEDAPRRCRYEAVEPNDDMLNIFSVLGASHRYRGLVGIDVGIAETGDMHIIEENYAPEWTSFERATGIDVAQHLTTYLRQRTQ